MSSGVFDERLIYPTAQRNGPPSRLDELFDACEAANLAVGHCVTSQPNSGGWDYRTRLLAPAFTLALSLEPLVDGRHFFAAQIIQRSILERVGSLFCIHQSPDVYLPKWEKGWKHKGPDKRPEFLELIKMIPILSDTAENTEEFRIFIRNSANRAVHSDPYSIVHLFLDTDDPNVKSVISGPLPEGHASIPHHEALIQIALLSLLNAAEVAFPEIVKS